MLLFWLKFAALSTLVLHSAAFKEVTALLRYELLCSLLQLQLEAISRHVAESCFASSSSIPGFSHADATILVQAP